MTGGRIVVHDTLEGPPKEKAQIRLAMSGDDLVALVNGELNFAKAWGSGRVKLVAYSLPGSAIGGALTTCLMP